MEFCHPLIVCRGGGRLSSALPVYSRPMDQTAISVFVLAGGKSTRMGADKAFVMLQGRALLERALDLARSIGDRVAIVGDSGKYAQFAPIVEDVFPGCGPLGGIHAALRSSPTDLNLILAVDLPFVPAALLQYLVSKAVESPAALVTVPQTSQGRQPLCAIYRREFADRAEESLRSGRYKIDALFDKECTRVITETELRSAGFSSDVFRNLNSVDDLKEASDFIRLDPI